MRGIDTHIKEVLDDTAQRIEESPELNCAVIAYVGPIHPQIIDTFISKIEQVRHRIDQQEGHPNPRRLAIMLTTGGGVVEVIEKMVQVTRRHFDEVFFIVPMQAMSAGTIWCMSGDKIFMDYTSSLGPIDPQVQNPEGQFVPALGYIDKVNEIIDKPQGTISDAEAMMINRLDLATLRRYEQARDLSITLLKEWLVQYKFKDWTHHRTHNQGKPVTHDEKIERASQIAQDLSNNNIWHSHGRMISIDTLRDKLHLEIEDYTDHTNLREHLKSYAGLLVEYINNTNQAFIVHSTTAGASS
ncbi:SDH family Clp fold serine proteinase [Halomonas elongata]|uniref:Peptidase S49 family protein n=1 Tax=Halomonas elongata (strain ATCC 33173 / DSM 2581 / NBRC 15536 / NCIMB 2198 / 1H9) TaxID=768066 RepID=A0A1R4A4I8_HALED|nr:hypothetical protein [Halomonas elongata]WBF17843.1 hypothetical protein LM502_17525 [Halomonas elongata]WPU46688.1 hypothetical protein SR933_15775 [Halomonas elongata DSM 2581]SJK83888.1 peptidase S49 family protein [Halomonas elongata DSM 2581]